MKFLASFFFMFLFCFVSYSAEITAKIVKIVDGDTIKVEEMSGDFKGKFVVRLYGIDAPEKDQEFGLESKKELLKILDKVAVIKFASTDRYGRLIGEVFVGENSVNLSMLKNGFAWYFSDYTKNDNYKNAELLAKKNKIGLWKSVNAIPPWDFRKFGKLESKNNVKMQ